ncbi:MAG: oxidase [Candidatus Marinimicrobia bacterium]|nr:oxidase [Candidatus Neomarinimicrobiota bacterium]|tara:strand:- start:1101 stop:2858 length:1758 start_codon:yes stop_codon:yes gene_type:complete
MDKTKKFFAVNEKNWGHRWGYKDSAFVSKGDKTVSLTGNRYEICAKNLPGLIPFAEDVLGIKVLPNPQIKEVEKKYVANQKLNQPFMDDLVSVFDEDRFSSSDKERLLHSHGQTTSDEVYKVLYSKLETFTDLVFYIESEEEAKTLISLAKKHDVCLVPYGGGTSVSNALKIPKNEKRMVVSVDTRRMNKIESVDEENLLATVQCGVLGVDLERKLQAMGYTSGHEPDSIEFSTLGGWISTNASGMKKHRYGNIEDIVQNITLITPEGTINQIKPLTRSSIGVKTQNLIFGSEGNFGIITKATIKIHKKPEASTFESILFHNWEDGVSFMKKVARSNLVPASSRLMDNSMVRFASALKEEKVGSKKLLESIKNFFVFKIKGFNPKKCVVAIFKMEGSSQEVLYQKKNLKVLAKEFNPVFAGSGQGKSGYNLTLAIAYIRDFFMDQNIIGETLESAVPWSDVIKVSEAVTRKLKELHKANNLPGSFLFGSRLSKVYHSGACMYNTIAMSFRGVENPEKVFGEIEHALRKTIIENGGSISHHHGVGKLRKDFIPNMVSEGSVQVVKDIKNSQDPTNVFGVANNVFSD